MLPDRLLGPEDPAPVIAVPGPHPRLLIVVDHAGRDVPRALGRLGLAEADLARHIGWDIGAADIAGRLAEATGATLVRTVYSRLVVDANRYPHDPAASPESVDATPVPGNRGLAPAARHRRMEELHRPYHDRIAAELDRLGPGAFLLSVHTMTDRPRTGPARAEEIALSWHADRASTAAALAVLGAEPGLTVGDNTPYAIDPGEDFTTPEHAVRRGLPHLQVEFRQDLVATPEAARAWADRFLPALAAALAL